jgi:hypothetical protein
MANLLNTVTVTENWQTIGDIKTANVRQIALFIDRYKHDSSGLEIRLLGIEDGKTFPFFTQSTIKHEITLIPKHYNINDTDSDAVLVELLYDLFDSISIQCKVEKVGKTPDQITISYKGKIFK